MRTIGSDSVHVDDILLLSGELGRVFSGSALLALPGRLPTLEVLSSLLAPATLIGVAASSVEGVGSTGCEDDVIEAPCLLSRKKGTKKRTQERNIIGPIIFNTFFALSLTI